MIDAQKRPKVITAIGCFYDLEDPVRFVRDVAAVLAPDGVFIAQLMCLWNMLKMDDIGNINHEHLEYYSLQSLSCLYDQAGLEIIDIQEVPVNGSSYRIFSKRKGSHVRPLPGATQRIAEAVGREQTYSDPATYFDFYKRAGTIHSKIVGFINEAILDGKSVWIYGSSTKGNTLLQWWGLDTLQITAAAERSPEKWGHVTVGTNIPIFPEAKFREASPDYALVLPYTFIEEFKTRELEWMLSGGRFIVPMPTPRVVLWDKKAIAFKEEPL
jgi:NDP-4-keto-2,6-dideoxyhexose 3-C-methyltransferase